MSPVEAMGPVDALVRYSGAMLQPTAGDISITRMRIFGTRVWMIYRRDDNEWDRRQTHGLRAVLAWDLLDTLMDLPAGMPVPLMALAGPVCRRLRGAPPGVVHVSGPTVTRQLVPAVTPLLAVIARRNWRRGFVDASRFAPYCRRMVVATNLRDDEAEALTVAGLYGIGVAVGDAHSADVLLEPEPVPQWQPTPAWWRFAETIYGQAVIRHS